MRGSREKERTHLPKDSTEVWLETQTPMPSEAKHRNPPEDTYEAWVERRVAGSRGTKRTTLKR